MSSNYRSQMLQADQWPAEQVIAFLTDRNAVIPEMANPYEIRDCVRKGFFVIDGRVTDFGIVEDKGTFHLFYGELRLHRSSRFPWNIVTINHAASRDLDTWTVHKPALWVQPGTWEGGSVVGATFVQKDGRFHMFYHGTTELFSQSIGVAMSQDLMQWEKFDNNPVLHPGHFPWALWTRAGMSNCRDPYVVAHMDEYLMYYTALTKDAKMVVAMGRSTNLYDWQDGGVVFSRSPKGVPMMTESPCVQRRDDGVWVLFYSQNYATWAVLSESPFSWCGRESFVVLPEYLALEVVCRRGDRWLVAAFNQPHVDPGCQSRMHLGILDWSKRDPHIEILTDPADVHPFLATEA